MGYEMNPNIAYDENGNIKGLQLYSSILIDNLMYTNQTNSNKLQNVVESFNNTLTKLGL
jgi:hypothetical protein